MKNRITKLLALLMAAAIVLSLAACGKKDEDETTTAASTAAASETSAPGDTTASEETTAGDATTNPGDTTAVGETTTAAAVTKPESKEQILAAYTAVMNKAKTDKPGYTKYEFQALPKDGRNISGGSIVVNPLLSIASGFMTDEDKAKKEPSINAKGGNMNGFPVKNSSKGCMLTDVSAIKTVKSELRSNGNYVITIILNDEMNPEHYQSGTTAPSKTGSMFTPLSKSDIDPELAKISIIKDAKYSLKYYNCTAVLEYNPTTNQIVSLNQTTYTLAEMSGQVVIKASGSVVLEMYYKYFDFKY